MTLFIGGAWDGRNVELPPRQKSAGCSVPVEIDLSTLPANMRLCDAPRAREIHRYWPMSLKFEGRSRDVMAFTDVTIDEILQLLLDNYRPQKDPA